MKRVEDYIILSGRFTSRRTKVRKIKSGFDKYILDIERKRDKINRDPVYEMLPKPVQRGYVRTFQLTDEAKRMHDAELYQRILDLINTEQYSNYPIFCDKHGKKKAKKMKSVCCTQDVRGINNDEYYKLGERERKMFFPIFELNSKGEYYIKCYEFKYKWLFKLVVNPYMVDKIERVNWESEREYAFYSRILDRHYDRVIRIHDLYLAYHIQWKTFNRYKDDRAKAERELLKNIPLEKIVNLFE